MSQVDRFPRETSRQRGRVARRRSSGLLLFVPGLALWPVAPDPKDSYLLALAEASQAEFLVTGDRGLLSLEQHRSIRIITPAAMIEILKKAESGK